MAKLGLIWKQKPGSVHLKPILRALAGVRDQTRAGLYPPGTGGPWAATWAMGAQQTQSEERQTGKQTLAAEFRSSQHYLGD